jgi:alpha-1,6-mannosyltransferase
MLGTVLAALGGLGGRRILASDPILSDSPLSWITYGHGKIISTVVLYGGITLLTWAWIRMGREARAGRIRGRAVLVTTVIWMLPLLVCPPMFSNDVYSYLAQGDLPLHGMNPYHTGVAELPSVFDDNVTPIWQHTAAPYGPFFILLAEGVVSVIGYHQVLAVLVMRWLIVVPGFALCAWALPKLARHYGGKPRIALWLGLANPLTLIYLVGGPHNDLLMAGLLVAGCVLVLRRHPLWGFLLVSLAAAIKAPAALALPFLVWVWAADLRGSPKARFAKACSGAVPVFAAVLVVTTVAAGVDLGWIPALRANNVVVNWMSLPSGIGQIVGGIAGLLSGVDPNLFVDIARDLGFAAMLAIAARQWWLARHGGPEAIRRAGVALFFTVLLSPTTFPWYYFWPLMLCAGLTWSGTGLVIVVFGLVWSMLSTFPSGDTALYSAGYLVAATAFAAVTAISLVRYDPLRLSGKHSRDDRLTDFALPRPREKAVPAGTSS